MPKKPITRQCNRCGHRNDGKLKQCEQCGAGLIKHRFKMDHGKLARIHMLAQRKGLINGDDDEFYRLRLERFGITSSKQIKKPDVYVAVIKDFEALPDAA